LQFAVSEMAARWGEVLYRTATILAGLIAVLAAAEFLNNLSKAGPIIPIRPLLLAGAIWLIGRVCRYLLAGR
jgi:hypothetical protein